MKVVLSRESESDLFDVAFEIAKDSPRRAKSYALELRATCVSLARHHDRFPVVFNATEPLRRIVHGNYLIFYAVRSDHVRVSRIIHSARLIDPAMFQ